jgi:hypothetical protein
MMTPFGTLSLISARSNLSDAGPDRETFYGKRNNIA